MKRENVYYLAELRMVVAQCNQLFADYTFACSPARTHLAVDHDALHLGAGVTAAVGIVAAARMRQRFDTPLDQLYVVNDVLYRRLTGLGGLIHFVRAHLSSWLLATRIFYIIY